MKKTTFSQFMTPLKRESVSSSIMNLMIDYLLSRELKPGYRLPTESELSQQLGVGRNSVREAMKMLSSLGVIEVKRGVGTFISKTLSTPMLNPLILGLVFEQGATKDLIELRLLFDTGVTELAIQKATHKDIERLEQVNSKLKEAYEKGLVKSDELRDLDLNFHLTLLEITRNKLLIKLGKAVYTLFMASIEKSVSANPDHGFRNHKLVIDAIKTRDTGMIRKTIEASLAFWKSTLE